MTRAAPNIAMMARAVAAMDVLAPGIGEIIGGSQREERLDVLDQSMVERGIDRDHYAWYRDLRRSGTVTPPPHASSAPIATISPALAAPPSLAAAASPNTPSFLLWPDKSAQKMQTLRS